VEACARGGGEAVASTNAAATPTHTHARTCVGTQLMDDDVEGALGAQRRCSVNLLQLDAVRGCGREHAGREVARDLCGRAWFAGRACVCGIHVRAGRAVMGLERVSVEGLLVGDSTQKPAAGMAAESTRRLRAPCAVGPAERRECPRARAAPPCTPRVPPCPTDPLHTFLGSRAQPTMISEGEAIRRDRSRPFAGTELWGLGRAC
jgi:hypothetical protein